MMYSNTLVVLDYITQKVLFIRLTDEMVNKLEEEYENDSEAWIADSGLEEKFGFDISNANWMLCDTDDNPEIYYCYPSNGEKVQMFPCM